MLKIDAVAAFNDNYIWLIHAADMQHVLIVDPGDAGPVIKAVYEQNLIPVAILITHGCHDHVDGIEALINEYNVPVYGPENEFIPHITHPVSACDGVSVDPLFPEIRIIDIPGHTAGHIGFLVEGNLFCGDTLFAAGCGRLHGQPAELLFQSLQQISRLAPETHIYCAHEYTEDNLRFAERIEPNNQAIKKRVTSTLALRKEGLMSVPSLLGLELHTNPFLRCDKEDVKNTVEEHSLQQLETPQQVFKALRKWKDDF